jgi:serine/threonine-protein kinase
MTSGPGSPPPSTVTDQAVGRVIADRYEIVAPLKEGGMGQVYVALQRSLERKVALKLIRPDLQSDERTSQRFFVEARAASQLNHPNVVSIYDFGRCEDGEQELYLVMELLAGPDLRAVMDGGAMPTPRIIDIVCQMLAGLAEAHDHNITHRDMKPENIVLQTTRRGGDLVKVIDFGVAKTARSNKITLTGQFVGTPWYSAPEQAEGPHGSLADIYSVGVMLFELLTGVVPFDASGLIQLLIMHRTDPRPDATKVGMEKGRQVSRALADICTRAMAIDPLERFQSADTMIDALWAADESKNPAAPPDALQPGRKPTILVLEDDASVRTMLVRMLETKYTVHQAEDGVAALSLLEQIPLPDLIISDIMMPRMDGLTFAGRMRAHDKLRAVPLIFLSARSEIRDVVAGIEAGARHYLTKPVQMKELLARVARVLARG